MMSYVDVDVCRSIVKSRDLWDLMGSNSNIMVVRYGVAIGVGWEWMDQCDEAERERRERGGGEIVN